MMEINVENFETPNVFFENSRLVRFFDGNWYFDSFDLEKEDELVDENIWDIDIVLRDRYGEPDVGVATKTTIIFLERDGSRQLCIANGVSLKEEDFLGLDLEVAVEKLKGVNYFIRKIDGVVQNHVGENFKYFQLAFPDYPYLITNRYNLEIENNKVVKIFRG